MPSTPTELVPVSITPSIHQEKQEMAAPPPPLSTAMTQLKEEGNQLFRTGHHAAAIDKYSTAINELEDDDSQDQNLAVLYSNRAVCRTKIGDPSGCIEDCNYALTLSPHNVKAILRRAKAYEEKEKYRQAYVDYRQALSIDHNIDIAQQGSSRLQAILKAQDGANWREKLPPLSFASRPSIPPYSQTQKVVLAQEKEAQDTLVQGPEEFHVRETTESVQDSKSEQGNETMPSTLREQDPESAPSSVQDGKQEIMAQAPPLPPVMAKLKEEGNQLFRMGHYLAAIETYTKVINNVENDESQAHNLAILYSNRAACKTKLGDTWGCIEDCNYALTLSPHYVKALLRRAMANEETKRYHQAYLDYQKALNMDQSLDIAKQCSSRLLAVLKAQNGANMGGKHQPVSCSNDHLHFQPQKLAPRQEKEVQEMLSRVHQKEETTQSVQDSPSKQKFETTLCSTSEQVSESVTHDVQEEEQGMAAPPPPQSAAGEITQSFQDPPSKPKFETTLRPTSEQVSESDTHDVPEENQRKAAPPPLQSAGKTTQTFQDPPSKQKYETMLRSTIEQVTESVTHYDPEEKKRIAAPPRPLSVGETTQTFQDPPSKQKFETMLRSTSEQVSESVTHDVPDEKQRMDAPPPPLSDGETTQTFQDLPSKHKFETMLLSTSELVDKQDEKQIMAAPPPPLSAGETTQTFQDPPSKQKFETILRFISEQVSESCTNDVQEENPVMAAPPPPLSAGDTTQSFQDPPSKPKFETMLRSTGKQVDKQEEKQIMGAPPRPLPAAMLKLKEEGNELFRAGHHAAAIQKYSTVINKLENDDSQTQNLAVLYSNRAACKTKIGNPSGCTEDCNYALTLSPHNMKALLRRAVAYEELEKYRKAYVDYRHVLNMDHSIEIAQQGSSRLQVALIVQDGVKWREKLPPIPSVPPKKTAQLFPDLQIKQGVEIMPSYRSEKISETVTTSVQEEKQEIAVTPMPLSEAKDTAQLSPDIQIKQEVETMPSDLSENITGAVATSVQEGKQEITVSPPPLSAAMTKLKEEGNQLFRIGHHVAAIDKYSIIINKLENGEYQAQNLAVLYSNRAACKTKIGDSSGCIEDCNYALNLSPHNVKALIRRAIAYEVEEKYQQAYVDFRHVLNINYSIEIAQQGSSRLQVALNAQDGAKWREKLPPIPLISSKETAQLLPDLQIKQEVETTMRNILSEQMSETVATNVQEEKLETAMPPPLQSAAKDIGQLSPDLQIKHDIETMPSIQSEKISETVITSVKEEKQEIAVSPPPLSAAMTKLKEEGNQLFRIGHHVAAIDKYSIVIDKLENSEYQAQNLAVLYSNRAACKTKIGDSSGCIEDCNYALNLSPHNVKALIRRAIAYEVEEKHQKAYVDYRHVLNVDPSIEIAQQGSSRLQVALKAQDGAKWREKLPPIPSVSPKETAQLVPDLQIRQEVEIMPSIRSEKISETVTTSVQEEKQEIAVPTSPLSAVSATKETAQLSPDLQIKHEVETMPSILVATSVQEEKPEITVSPPPLSAAMAKLKEEGNQLFRTGHHVAAIDKYSVVINKLENDEYQMQNLAVLYSNRAACKTKIGDTSGCIEDCNYALNLSPHNVKALLRRAIAYEGEEKYQQAYVDYRHVLNIDYSIEIAQQGSSRLQVALKAQDGAKWREKLPPIPLVSSKETAQLLPDLQIKQEVETTMQNILSEQISETVATSVQEEKQETAVPPPPQSAANETAQLSPDLQIKHDIETMPSIQSERISETVATSVQEEKQEIAVSPPPLPRAIAKLKEEGNQLFRTGHHVAAIDKYSIVINKLENDESQVQNLAVLYSNRAACKTKIGDTSGCIEDCNYALNLSPNNVKALIRRAIAYEEEEKYRKAYVDYRHVLNIDHSIEIAQQGCSRLQVALKAQDGAKWREKLPPIPSVSPKEAAQLIQDLQIKPEVKTMPSILSEKISETVATSVQEVKQELAVPPSPMSAAKETAQFVTDLQIKHETETMSSILSEKISEAAATSFQEEKQEIAIPPPPLSAAMAKLKEEGNQLFRTGRHAAAIDKYSVVINQLETDESQAQNLAVLYSNRAACKTKIGDTSGCIEDCNYSLTLSPHNVKALLRRAVAYEENEKYRQAYADYRHALSIEHNIDIAQQGTSRLQVVLKAQDGANWREKLPHIPSVSRSSLPLWSQPQKVVRSSLTPRFQPQEVVPTQEKGFSIAEKLFQEQQKSDEQLYEKHKIEGNNHVKTNRFQEAIECYSKCIELNPFKAVGFTNRALCFLRLNKAEAVLNDCENAAQLEPFNIKAWYRSAQAHKMRKDYRASEQDLELVLMLDENNSAAQRELKVVQNYLAEIRSGRFIA